MKKLITKTLLIASLAVSSQAVSFDNKSLDLILSHQNNGNIETSGGLHLKGENKIYDNLYLGLGIGAETDGDGLFGDVYTTLSYKVDKDLSVNTLVGYSAGSSSEDGVDYDAKGMIYGAGLEHTINDKVSVGLMYKVHKADVEANGIETDEDIERVSLYFSQKF